MTPTTVKFKKWECELKFKAYSNGRTAIELVDHIDGSPIAVATVNLPDEPLDESEVFIKDYSENEGMLVALINANIISYPISFVESGFVTIPKCKLLTNNDRQ